MIQCKKCLMDQSVEDLSINRDGICQFCEIHYELNKDYTDTNPDILFKRLKIISKKIKEEGENKKYDVVVGVSGGKDSSYCLYVAKEILKLRPLAVHFDNGFNSETSVKNIFNMCNKLDIDLHTEVVDWNSFKEITRSFIKASVPDIDIPTDIGIFKTIYETANKNNVKWVINGHSYKTEGLDPLSWTYMDGLYLNNIYKKYGRVKLKNYKFNFTLYDFLKYKIVKNIKTLLPLNYIEYDDNEARELLRKKFNWEYYGGHHHESVFTKFSVSSYLPKKFNIDRRKTDFSALIRSGKITKKDGQALLEKKIQTNDEHEITKYVLNKLEITNEEYNQILLSRNLNYKNFKTYKNYFKYAQVFVYFLVKIKLVPKILYLKFFKA